MSKDDIKVPVKAKRQGPNQVQVKTKQVIDTTKSVINGLEHFVLATSLTIVAFYNLYDLLNRNVGSFEYWVRATASTVIGMFGAWAIIKVFKAIGEQKG